MDTIKGSLILDKNQPGGTLLEAGCTLVIEYGDESAIADSYRKPLRTREPEISLLRLGELLGWFSEEELRDFCFYTSEFKDAIYDDLPQGKTQVIREILGFADRRGLISALLGWAETENPVRYREWRDGKLPGQYIVEPRSEV